MIFLKAINFFFDLMAIKYEIDNKNYVRAEYLFETYLKTISKAILENLVDVLRDDIVFIVSPGSQTIFKEISKEECGDLVAIEKCSHKFKSKAISLSKISSLNPKKVYFFIDKTGRKFIYKFKEYNLECVNFDKSLNYSKESRIADNFINLFNKVKEENFSAFYRETLLEIRKNKVYKEVILSNQHVGTIHKTIYHTLNNLYQDIKDHFISFYKNMSIDLFINLSEKYINSLISLMIRKGILKNDILKKDIKEKPELTDGYIDGLIEDLFPFKFYEKMTKNFEENNFVSGGICFDRILANPFLKEYVNVDLIKKNGYRFIITGVVRRKQGMLSVEVI